MLFRKLYCKDSKKTEGPDETWLAHLWFGPNSMHLCCPYFFIDLSALHMGLDVITLLLRKSI